VPGDLNLSLFMGATLVQVCLGQYEIQFNFQRNGGISSISCEGEWRIVDAGGNVIDYAKENSEREAYRVQVLLGQEVVETVIDAPHSFSLRFRAGHTLQVFDSSDRYESFSIQPGDVFV
jgi:hypothetical protein